MVSSMKKKIDMVAVLVYFVMAFLILLIILPPVLRFSLTNDEESLFEPTDQVQALICNKTENIDNYNLKTTIRTNYKNDQVTALKFTWLKVIDENLEENNVLPKDDESNLLDYEQTILDLKGISGAVVVDDENETVITLNENILKNNVNNSLLAKFKQDIIIQQENYEKMGMICNIY